MEQVGSESTMGRIICCRTCKSEAVSQIMWSIRGELKLDTDETKRIDAMLMACTSVKINNNDGLPNSICELCMQQLQLAYTFKLRCEATDALLRNEYAMFTKKVGNKTSSATVEDPQLINLSENELDDDNTVIEGSDEELDGDLNMFTHSKNENDDVSLNAVETDNVDCSILITSARVSGDNVILTVAPKDEPSDEPVPVLNVQQDEILSGLELYRRDKRKRSSNYKCGQCDKVFSRPGHLHRHELTHGSQKLHVCKICNKMITRFDHLKRHMMSHLKVKPFSCATCNRGFVRSEHLANHRDRCKGNKNFVCDICNKGFLREDSLEVHRQLHGDNLPQTLATIVSLDNIHEHYFEINCDDGTYPKGQVTDPVECLETEMKVGESLDKIENQPTNRHAYNTRFNNALEMENDELLDFVDDKEDLKLQLQMQLENGNTEYTGAVESADDGYNDDGQPLKRRHQLKSNAIDFDYEVDLSDTDESDYKPLKQPSPKKVKRGRGRPRKHPLVLKKKVTGRKRGRPRKHVVEPPSCEDDEFDVFDDDEDEQDTYFDDNYDEEELLSDGTIVRKKYTCAECGEEFENLSDLEEHSDRHADAHVFECNICEKRFGRSILLRRHSVTHPENKPYRCQICTKQFQRNEHLLNHMELHEQNTECKHCRKPYSCPKQLQRHMASLHGDGEKIAPVKRYKCKLCEKSFAKAKYRDIHLVAHMEARRFKCKWCSKGFPSKLHLSAHVKLHSDASKKFLCSECGQRFIRNDYLVIHMRRHRGEKPFKCKFCGKGFPRTTDLTVHERYHTGEKTHLCVICGRGFGRAYNLTVHMRTHTGEKPYQCSYCDAAFAQGNDLKSHVRRHTGERFQCDHCSETFLMGYLLTQHKRSVHGLNVVSNIRRLLPLKKLDPDDPNEPPPVTIPLPPPVIPSKLEHGCVSSHNDLKEYQQYELDQDEEQDELSSTVSDHDVDDVSEAPPQQSIVAVALPIRALNNGAVLHLQQQ